MITRSQKIRLGIFITTGIVIFLAIIAVLSINRFFKEKDIYYIVYEDVSVMGLDVGSPVKYLGINVGSIQDIYIDPEDVNRIIVRIGLKRDTPIKTDIRADISTIGITGIKIIELRGGSNEAATLNAGGFINAGKSLTEEITGKAEDIANKIEMTLNNLLDLTSDVNQEKIIRLVDESSSAIAHINSILAKNRSNIQHSIANFDTMTHHLAYTSKSTRRVAEGLDRIVSSDSFKTAINNLVKITNKIEESDVNNLVERLNETALKINEVVIQTERILRDNHTMINETVYNLNQTVRSLKNAARLIEEDPSVLLGGAEPDNPPDEKLE